jgi:hypothetical protein
MTKLIANIIAGIAFLCVTDLSAQWKDISNGIDTQRVQAMQFISSSRGFAVGDSSTAFKTVNGGDDWIPIRPLDCAGCVVDFKRVLFFESERGYLWGIDRATGFTRALMTTNGGQSWTSTDTLGASVCYATEEFGYRMKSEFSRVTVSMTNDMGKTWDRRYAQDFTPYFDFGEIGGKFADSLNGIIWEYIHQGHETNPPLEYPYHYTTDGGRTWLDAEEPPSHYASASSGKWIGWRNDHVERSEDAGKSWDSIVKPAFEIKSFFPLTPNLIYGHVGYSQSIACSKDGGYSWTFEHVADISIAPIVMFRFEEASEDRRYLMARTTSGGVRIYKASSTISRVGLAEQKQLLHYEISADRKALLITCVASEPRLHPQLYDVMGREIQTTSAITSNVWSIDISRLAEGAYFAICDDQVVKLLITE